MTERLIPVELTVDREAILHYARIADDYNPIHVDPAFAARSGFGGIIAHGTLSLNLIWQSIALSFADRAALPALVDIRFRAPVREADRVEAGGERRADGGWDVWVRNQDGVTVIEGTAQLPG